MINQYYFKRLKLFKLPYKILLAYHSPIGNTIKTWVSYRMLSNILIIRNDVHILNLGLTVIQLRKAINALFYRMQARGTFLIYAEAHNALNLNHDSVFIFANSWLPGLLTNYRRVSLSVAVNKFHKSRIYPFLSRTQLTATNNIRLKPFLRSILRFKKGKVPRIPKLPTISFSVLDNFIWLNECHNLKIPSIQLCDTQSFFDKVTYPIVANQRSVPLTYLLVHLFSEVCTNALLDSHLAFISYYKYLSKKNLCEKKVTRILARRKKRNRKIRIAKKVKRLNKKKVYKSKLKLKKNIVPLSIRYRKRLKKLKKRKYFFKSRLKKKIKRFILRRLLRKPRFRKLKYRQNKKKVVKNDYKKLRKLIAISLKKQNLQYQEDDKKRTLNIYSLLIKKLNYLTKNHTTTLYNIYHNNPREKHVIKQKNTFVYDNRSCSFIIQKKYISYAKVPLNLLPSKYFFFHYLKNLLWSIILLSKKNYTQYVKFFKKMRLYRRKLRRKYFIIKRMKKISKTIKEKKLKYFKKLIFLSRIKKKRNYKYYKAVRLSLHHFVKRFLSKNEIITRTQGKRSYYLTRVYLTKQDVKNHYCIYFLSNLKLLNRILTLKQFPIKI